MSKKSKQSKAFLKTGGIQATVHEGAQYNYKVIRRSEIFENNNADPKIIVNQSSRNTLVNKSRHFYENVAPLKAAVDEIASYAVGAGFTPIYEGQDAEWGIKATEWLQNWYRICDPIGYDLTTDLWMSSTALDRDGDVLLYLTKAADGKYPKISFVPAHRIAYKDNSKTIEEGPFKGYEVYDGVVCDENRPIGYSIELEDNKYEVLSAVDAMMLFEPKYPLQLRGFPAIAASITNWTDFKDINEFEREAIKQAAAISLIEKNQVGGVLPGQFQFATSQSFSGPDGSSQPVFYKYYNGGTVRYFGSNDPNSGVEQMKNDRPGDLTQTFIKDHILRGAFSNLGLPIEMAFDMSGMNSANTRAILSKVKRKLITRQNTLVRTARRISIYGLASAIKLGFLPPNKDWYKFSFVLPPSPSIDMGRDSNADINYYKIAGTTLSDIWGEDGSNWERKIKQYCYELKRIDEIAKEQGIDPARVQSGLYNGNQLPQSPSSNTTNTKPTQ